MVCHDILKSLRIFLAFLPVHLFVSKDINKAGIIGSLALYVVYTYVEVKVLMRLSKNSPKNG